MMREAGEAHIYYINVHFSIYTKYVENPNKEKFDIG
jgi:hypothetical protein